jgi:hypothetical protein
LSSIHDYDDDDDDESSQLKIEDESELLIRLYQDSSGFGM